MQGNLSVERMCYLAQVSRASFYRSLAERKPAEEEMEVRSAIRCGLFGRLGDHRRRLHLWPRPARACYVRQNA
jgi:hypothetical protein